MTTRLFRIIFPVNDIETAAKFYSNLFGFEGIRVSPGRLYFKLGETILACYDPLADGDDIGNGWQFHENQYIYLAVNDLGAIHEKIKSSNATFVGEIEQMPWGETLFYANDPFGNPVCFVDEKTVFKGE